MDCILLSCACLTLKIRFRWWRVALGAGVGTVTALATVYVDGFWIYPAKAACLFLMCIVTVGFGKKLFWHILLTLAYTFVTGGAIVGLFNLLQVDYLSQNGLCYNMPVPLFVYFLAVGLVIFLCYSVAVFVKQTKKVAPFIKKVQVVLGDATYSVSGFCDSGNTVCHNGVPVCFVTKKFRGFAEFFASQTLNGAAVSVSIATLAGSKTVAAVPAKLQCKDCPLCDVYLALPAEKCQTQYELLLSNQIFGGEI
ncbi:MAG: sigma-E processing peptidase SpoIIGA [Corallococcus sp.]|nr:sigma-E processing peptidase SpoIIGA [Corallococcus sp.]MCM1360021.1 sigma-E processing peptidase SpoIIGA [Corallococcus sp.]